MNMNLESGLGGGPGASSTASNIMDSARRLLGVEQRPKTRCEQLEEDMCGWVPALTWQSRLFGCLFCFLIGTILQFGSFFRFAKLLAGNPEPFALMYTLGNIVSIGGSCFLSGPWSQVKSMFHPTRAICTAIYITTLILTLIVSFTDPFLGQGPLLVLLIILQFSSSVYYILSYIPFARTFVWQTCGSCLGLGQESTSGSGLV